MKWDKIEKLRVIQQLASSNSDILINALTRVINNPDCDFLHALMNLQSGDSEIDEYREKALTEVRGVLPVPERQGAPGEELREYSPVEIRVDFSKIQTSKQSERRDGSGFRQNLKHRFQRRVSEYGEENTSETMEIHESEDLLSDNIEIDIPEILQPDLSEDKSDFSESFDDQEWNEQELEELNFQLIPDKSSEPLPEARREINFETKEKPVLQEPVFQKKGEKELPVIEEQRNPLILQEKKVFTFSEEEWIDEVFSSAINQDASDIHLSSGDCPFFRIQGELKRIQDWGTLSREKLEKILFSLIQDSDCEKLSREKELDFSLKLENHSVRLRGNYFYDFNGLSAVFRIVPGKILTAEDLKLEQGIMDFCKLHKGLVLVTGPTGSGKSTTLAAMIDWINKNRNCHILTIEDPVEFYHQPRKSKVTHREVKKNTHSFASALKSALRQDPDVILIGELRDTESIEIALQAAETGHLVFGTLHTRTAPQTIDRIIHVFDAGRQEQIRTMLSESIVGVISQVLIRSSITGKRVVAQELMNTNPAIGNMIRKNTIFQIYDVMRTSHKLGMRTLFQGIQKLIETGKILPEDAVEHCLYPEEREELENMRFS